MAQRYSAGLQRPANVESHSDWFSGTRIARELFREAFAHIRNAMCFELRLARVSWHLFAGWI